MSDIAETFRLLVDDALALDPDAIRSTIRSTIDDGLRAARYDGTGGRDADQSSHPERMAIHGRRDPAWADLDLIDHHAERFICAVTELALRSHSRGAPRSWDEAVQDAHLLAEMDAVGILERTGQRPSRWVHQAGDAVHDLALIGRRHMARVPDGFDRLMSGDPVCLSHARIGDYERPRHGKLVLCKTCRDLIAQVAEPTEVHRDSQWWPSMDLLREHADMERTGRRTDYQRARVEWIAGFPPRRIA